MSLNENRRMNKLSLLLWIQVMCIAVALDYETRCPAAGEWHFRGRKFNCGSTQYVCLLHTSWNIYHENCDGLDYSSTGSKLIFEPFFNKALCSFNRYQPFPFSTDGNSACVYQKSFCSEKGQYVFQKGSLTSDTTCGCDLSSGYEFVSRPTNNCYCIPSEEDCSCHKLICYDKDEQCPQDNDVVKKRRLADVTTLTTLYEGRLNDTNYIFSEGVSGKRHRNQCLYISTILLIVMIIVVVSAYAMQPEFEIRRNVRIHVIGQHGAKTCLVHRLLGETICDVKSTDGGDIVKKCKIRTSDGKWIFDKDMDIVSLTAKESGNTMTADDFVKCSLYDFAVHKEYFVTHQNFSTTRAIYLLVADISKSIKDFEGHDGRLDGTKDISKIVEHFEDYDSSFNYIDENIDFWFDNIHCLNMDYNCGDTLYPAIILVCTHTDSFQKSDVEKVTKEYERRFKKKKYHTRAIHFISNVKPSDKDITELQNSISQVAKEMDYFTETPPSRWIQLQNTLSVLKKQHIEILSWDETMKIAQNASINENELLLFLASQHKIGNVIFFEEIRDYIILNPDWLVKCCRCLVLDWQTEKKNTILKDWPCLEYRGELSDSLINLLFENEPGLNFTKNKVHLLNVMEKFDVIVKPKFFDGINVDCQISNSYYILSMITDNKSIKSLQTMFKSDNTSPWLVLEFEFLPLAYFNYILSYYIRKYDVCVNIENAIYSRKTLFCLDKPKRIKLLICFSKNAVSLQIWDSLDYVIHVIYKDILEEICDIIEQLKKTLSLKLAYDIKTTCSIGDYSDIKSRISYTKRLEGDSYACKYHGKRHGMDDEYKTWLKHVDFVKKKLHKR